MILGVTGLSPKNFKCVEINAPFVKYLETYWFLHSADTPEYKH